MRIAIVGSGISGLVVAHRLHASHEITLYEANDYVGGHANTVDVAVGDERHAIDTGFIVFNDRTYPNFVRLLDELGVASRPTTMSFSVRDERSGLEYNGHSLNTLFAQRRNLLRPSFCRMIVDIVRFNREARRLARACSEETTVGEFLQRQNYSRAFAEHYLLPMGAAIWSCPIGTFADFPIRFILEFYDHHGLLDLRDRPQWRTIIGGSQTYVRAMTRGFQDRIRLNTPVRGVRRLAERVEVHVANGDIEPFDHVVFACHSDQALSILGVDATPTERETLSAFPYGRNVAILHADSSVLPRTRRAWASWNYRVTPEAAGSATLTYNMNILQGLRSRHTFCVTLNDEASIDPSLVLRRFVYHHPIFTARRALAQSRHAAMTWSNRTSFCGAYWGNGFHEDGVRSALAVVDALKKSESAFRRPVTMLTALTQ